MKYLSIGLRLLLTAVFIAAGGAKLAGLDMMVATFEQIGIGQWFRYLTGLIEIAGAVLLWIPGRQVFGAGMLGVTMLGAMAAHLLILGPTVLPAFVLGLLCAAVLYLHRGQISAFMPRRG